MKICLASLTASHYRHLIYHLLDKELDLNFVFGQGNTTVKQMDFSQLKNVKTVSLCPIGKSKIYRMPGACKQMLKSDIIIDDTGILCITSWIILFLSKLLSKKVFLWTHGWYGREGKVKSIIKRIYSALASGTMVYGEYARKLMIENGFNADKIAVIHNSLDYDTQIEIRNSKLQSNIYKEHFRNNYPNLIFIGRLTPTKQLHMILEAMVLLKNKSEFFNLVFVGDGEEEARLRKITEKNGLKDNVWFYGASYGEETNAILLYNADLCVAPGNIGLTAMHALMFGCPCLSHNDFPNQMPEFEAIIPDKTGLFFTRNDTLSLANEISTWFRKHGDDRDLIRQNCYNEIESNWNPYRQLKIISNFILK